MFCGRAIFAAPLLGAFLLNANAAPIPAPSEWKINPSASFSSDNGPVAPDKILKITAFSTSGIAMTERFTDQNGNTKEISWSGLPGITHSVRGLEGASGYIKTTGSYRFVLRDGTVEQGTFALSEKGRVLTDTYTVTPKGSTPIQVEDVYTRLAQGGDN